MLKKSHMTFGKNAISPICLNLGPTKDIKIELRFHPSVTTE